MTPGAPKYFSSRERKNWNLMLKFQISSLGLYRQYSKHMKCYGPVSQKLVNATVVTVCP